MLREFIKAGMTVARLNMSHGTHNDHRRRVQLIREASEEVGKPIAILADLQGPKLRTGIMQNGGVPLTKDETLVLTTEEIIGAPGRVPIQFRDLPRSVKPGDRILMDDGLLELQVTHTNSTEIETRVIIGGHLMNNKGMNLPNASLAIPSLSPKDLEDARFAIEQQVDYIALSFVRTAREVQDLKAFIRFNSLNSHEIPVIAKIEKPEAVHSIDAIIEAADAIMVARGDLGIETNPEYVPSIQKNIVAKCIQATKPVIIATQMLDSMTHKPRPTRAEVSDVANAILDGTDAVMLSGETASGDYPIEVVQMMARIASETEHVRVTGQHKIEYPRPKVSSLTDSLCHSTVDIARETNCKAILLPTMTGGTARLIAAYRPNTKIVALTPDPIVQRQLCLVWGTEAILTEQLDTADEVINDAIQHAQQQNLAAPGDNIVVTAGVASGGHHVTNLVVLRTIE
jgi:pyruvate kinase